MSNGLIHFKKALSIFGLTPETLSARLLERGQAEAQLPQFARSGSKGHGSRALKSWSLQEMPALGEVIGYLKKPMNPLAIGIFVTKGGVLKSSLTLNLARTAALHGIRVCVVGLDMQGDITTNLSDDESDFANSETSVMDAHGENESIQATESSDFAAAIAKMDATRGLADFYSGNCRLQDLIQPTDLPTLFYIPETPELVAMEQGLVNRNRREYWLKEKVVQPLKEEFDLIIMDCSPNWNRLITNALVASDVLITPLECKINNFRNFRAFSALIKEFREDLQADFAQVFVPTRLATGRKLSQEIFQWYRDQLPNCISGAIRESTQGEEAVALKISLPEHAPTSAAGVEMIQILTDVWEKALEHSAKMSKFRRTEESKLAHSTRGPMASESLLVN